MFNKIEKIEAYQKTRAQLFPRRSSRQLWSTQYTLSHIVLSDLLLSYICVELHWKSKTGSEEVINSKCLIRATFFRKHKCGGKSGIKKLPFFLTTTRPTFWQFWSFKTSRTTFMKNFIKYVNCQILRDSNCERVCRVVLPQPSITPQILRSTFFWAT